MEHLHLLEQWVKQARDGDETAFSNFVKATQRRLLSYAYPMLGNVQDAEDVVQEVYIRAYRHLDKYRQHGSVMAWLYTICYRLCINKLKKRSGLARLLPKLRLEAATSGRTEGDGMRSNDGLALLEGLNAEERNLVVMRVIHELSYEEISRITGSGAATLRKRYERIRKKLNDKCRTERAEATPNFELGREIESYGPSV